MSKEDMPRPADQALVNDAPTGHRPSGFDPSRWIAGKMYRVPWSPRPHRLEKVSAQYCQLHGDVIGCQLYLRKRRDSDRRPWGSTAVVAPSDAITLWDSTPCPA